ncbi:MAG: glycosyltransferase family 4 protein [Blautia sp.]|uniref:glycosyltransferase family 4 protein n=1 Tax=Blautia sp. TaxID=1955243 RepID=UPI003991F90F
MRILHFSSSDGIFGSAQCLKELLVQEVINGHTPIVVTPQKNQINSFCDDNKIENYYVSYQQFMIPKHDCFIKFCLKFFLRKAEYHLKINRAIRQVERIVDLSHIDLIHTNVSVVSIGALVAKKNNIPHVWHIREFGKEDFHFYPIFKNYISFMNSSADKFIAISDVVKNTWIAKGLNKEKISTYYDGVKLGNSRDLANEIVDNKVKIIMTGALSKTKGQEILIKAISRMEEDIKQSVEVDIYGSGMNGYEKILQGLIDENNLNSVVRLKGYSSEIRNQMLSYDIGVVCSASEGFGRVTVEYMLSKLVVVASNSGANPELLHNGEYGLLFRTFDEKDLSLVLVDAISKSKDREFRERVCKYAENQFVIENNAEKILECFDSLIK